MNRQELLDRLRTSEAGLYTPRVQNLFLDRDPADRDSFVLMRQSVGALVNQVTNQDLAAMEAAMSANEVELRSALTELEAVVSQEADHKRALTRISTAVSIISGVAGAAVGFLRQ